MYALAKKGAIRRKAELETRNTSIPVILPESHVISSDYITKCIDDGMFTTSYPAARMMFDGQNILQIHRDLNEHCASFYRSKMAEKLGRPDSLEVEFYIPAPDKYEKALLRYIELTVEEQMFALTKADAKIKFGKERFFCIEWNVLSGKKKELAKAMGIDADMPAKFFIPYAYTYADYR